MYRIGIDVGSTYTKYCVMSDGEIVTLFNEKTPIRQRVYFEEKVKELHKLYPKAEIISCGYGKANVAGIRNINELIALAKGAFYATAENGMVLDVGGQDTKLIVQEKGQLKEFYVNDKCAAGSGMFLISALELLGIDFSDIDLLMTREKQIQISSTCAVFAQSEIVEMIANNKTEEEILTAIVSHIFMKAKPLLAKTNSDKMILLSGGLSGIRDIDKLATRILLTDCYTVSNGLFLAALGCVLS